MNKNKVNKINVKNYHKVHENYSLHFHTQENKRSEGEVRVHMTKEENVKKRLLKSMLAATKKNKRSFMECAIFTSHINKFISLGPICKLEAH